MVERIKLVMEYKQLTPAQFAEAIGINRSNLTHIFSGRNLPSLELVRKILTTFPDISTEWLIMNVGNMLSSANEDFDFVDTPDVSAKPDIPKVIIQPDLFQDNSSGELNISTEKENSKSKVNSEVLEDNIKIEKEDIIQSDNKASLDIPVSVPFDEKKENSVLKAIPDRKKIEKVIFFYTNKTFDTYYPE